MLQFTINQDLCTRCGECAADCPANIIDLHGGYPDIPGDKKARCYRCQHCLAICPTGALSILGLHPEESRPLAGNLPDPRQLDTLIRGRRSVRRYRDENLDPALIRQLLETAWHAPTGHNARKVLFTVVDDRQVLHELRDEAMARIAEAVKAKSLPEGLEFFAHFVRVWQSRKQDVIFRGAPHFVVASAPKSCTTPSQDCLIALASFDLLAQNHGIGTLWSGLITWTIELILPDLRERIGIPQDHEIGYVMSFGPPAVHYPRTAQYHHAQISRARWP